MCGISGVISNSNVYTILYESLFNIQHRGQNSSGIALLEKNNIITYKSEGLLSNNKEIINNIQNIQNSNSKIGIGHVRYPTAGIIEDNEIQPFVSNNIALCHNGNIANYNELYNEYSENIVLNSKSDSELLLRIFEYELLKYNNTITDEVIYTIIHKLSLKCKGGYSVIIMIANYGLIGFKDPYGIRPLVYGEVNDSYIISSESVSISNLGYSYHIIKEIQGGEIIILKNNENKIIKNLYKYSNVVQKPCIFEWIYIAREDSIIHNVPVYNSRIKMGECLANRIRKENIDIHEIDLIIPVPETSKPVALQLSEELKIPYREAIIKNRYIARTFIMDNQYKRTKNIQRKLSVVKNIVENKNILIIDDSIVRGNTMKHIIDLLYKNNVKSIIVASSAPVIKYQNFYGLDIPTKEELIGYKNTIEEIEKKLNIKKLIYLSIDEICNVINSMNNNLLDFELSVFNGKYLH